MLRLADSCYLKIEIAEAAVVVQEHDDCLVLADCDDADGNVFVAAEQVVESAEHSLDLDMEMDVADTLVELTYFESLLDPRHEAAVLNEPGLAAVALSLSLGQSCLAAVHYLDYAGIQILSLH